MRCALAPSWPDVFRPSTSSPSRVVFAWMPGSCRSCPGMTRRQPGAFRLRNIDVMHSSEGVLERMRAGLEL